MTAANLTGAPEFAFEKLRQAASGLPEVIEGTSYGTPCLKVRNKFLCRIKDAETVVLTCACEDKEMLMESAPGIYFETPHYRDWPAILIRIARISPEELGHRMERAWLLQAPTTLVKAWRKPEK